MKIVFLFLLAVSLFMGGCFGCGSNKEMLQTPVIDPEGEEEKVRSKIAAEEEKMRRIAMEVFNAMESERKKSQPPMEIKQEQKPIIPVQKNFGIESSDASKKIIVFTAKEEKVSEIGIRIFGHIRALTIAEGMDRWELKVKATYDFNEVFEYLKSFEK